MKKYYFTCPKCGCHVFQKLACGDPGVVGVYAIMCRNCDLLQDWDEWKEENEKCLDG